MGYVKYIQLNKRNFKLVETHNFEINLTLIFYMLQKFNLTTSLLIIYFKVF